MTHPLHLITQMGRTTRGVLHVGANTGQEFEQYRDADIDLVVWVEADPETFRQLEATVSADPRHIALCGLCGPRDGETVTFYIASNGAAVLEHVRFRLAPRKASRMSRWSTARN